MKSSKRRIREAVSLTSVAAADLTTEGGVVHE